jgi:asparagine synthase (glutamine-hydrolysing)
MCGIVGAIEISADSKLNFGKDGLLYRYIASRGPDYYGTVSENIGDYKISLGHSRLSIIDLTEASHQPFSSEDGRYTLIYNGEIYNYKELRQELEQTGQAFKTTGDIEVLCRCWERWGVDCLPRLNGMFAIVVLDRQKRELFLIRDRFGVKPLVYGNLSGGGILFSSSVSAVALHAGSNIDMEYCTVGYRYGYLDGFENRTPFTGVKVVPPGTFIKYEFAGEKIFRTEKPWYDLATAVREKEIDLAGKPDTELLETGLELVTDATRLRLRSDVPVAISLSGGVDSTSIAALVKEEMEGLEGFTYGDPVSFRSEGPAVYRFAKRAGIKVNFVWPEWNATEVGDMLERTMAAQEAPILGLSVMAQQAVYQQVMEHGFKVLLGGQGGDEAFAGYRKFFMVALRSAVARKSVGESFSLLYSMGVLLIRGMKDYKEYWNHRNRYLANSGNEFSLLKDVAPTSVNLWGAENNSLSDRQILDIQHYSLPALLRYEDRNSMSYGIESRLPFLDYRVIEYALALPATLKIRRGYGKWALREFMADRVPASILKNYNKRGFDVTQNWIAGGAGDRLIGMLSDNKSNLAKYATLQPDFDRILTLKNLESRPNLVTEALILAFMADPIKPPLEVIR